ncbi:hypothetical protein, partial [uncultured Bacteroides sp.]|uniref:hypothetical protein n=1 Tax=uncultured Bacteroides sp. TaxID=162156 RepID=UPI00262D1132
MFRSQSPHIIFSGLTIIARSAPLFHLQELKGVGRSYLLSGQESKTGNYTGRHDRRDRANRQAEADKRKRTGEEQTDKNTPAKHPLQMLIISDIRVLLVFCKVELYSQLAGNAFP